MSHTMIHKDSTNLTWAATLRSDRPIPVINSRTSSTEKAWNSTIVKPEITPFRHTKRLSITEADITPKSTILHESPKAPAAARKTRDELRPADGVGRDDRFSWERSLRSSTQPKPVLCKPNGSMEDRPWRSSTRSAPVSLTHTRDPSLAASQAEGGAHSRQASGALHSRRGSVAEGRHSRRTSAVIHSRRSTRNSIKFEDEALAEELAPEPINEELPPPEPEQPQADMTIRTQPDPMEGPQPVRETLAGAMLVEQAELISTMTVKQVIEQLATGTTVSKSWVRGTKQRGSTRHVKARVANDLVLLQYPSGFSKRQMTVIVSSIYVTVEPLKTVLTLETDNGTLVIKPYSPEHATLWAFGFNALLHLADKQGLLDENTLISDLPWHGIFQSPKEEAVV